MKQILTWKKLPLLILACGLVVTVTVAQSNSGNSPYSVTDTIPKKQKKIRDLDEALMEIDRGEIEMQKALQEIDHEKMEKEIREAMKNIDVDMAKMKVDLAKAMKEIDMEKISLEVQKALKEIDGEKISREVKEALAKVDMKEIKVEMEKAKVEMEKAKNIDLSKMKEELARIQPEIEKAMKEAKVDIERAKKEITDYKNLVNALEQDGLLKKSENYKIEYKDKVLKVNGTALSAEATKKYSEFIGDKKDFTLQKNEDGIELDK
jgi:hypothetical protein